MLLDDYASRNDDLVDACAAWRSLDESAQEVFIWNTHRLYITNMLFDVNKLFGVFGRDSNGCGGLEYNRTFMGMTPALQAKLVNTWTDSQDEEKLSDWKKTGDRACAVSLPVPRQIWDPECPHQPYQYQVETELGEPRGQINFFGPSVFVGRRYLGIHDENCGEESLWAARSTVCSGDTCPCTEGVNCPATLSCGAYTDSVLFDPNLHAYSQGPEDQQVNVVGEYSFEMDHDYGRTHRSAPSCDNMKQAYSYRYGRPLWDWHPAGCGASGFTESHLMPRASVVRVSHIAEIRTRIEELRRRFGLRPVNWTDATIVPYVTPVKAVHVMELRGALDAVYVAARRNVPAYTDTVIVPGVTPIRSAHLKELQQAVVALEVP